MVQPYWQPSFTEPKAPDFKALAAEFRERMAEGVRHQLDGSRAACFLSGGTDSSTVAGMIGKVSGTPAATFSIGFDAAGYDEMAYARIASRAYGTEHHEYYVTPADLVAHIPKVAASYDQPFGNSSALPAYCCAMLAREQGVTRILAGDGGDELFGGNSRYAKQQVFEVYGRVPGVLRRGLIEPLVKLPFADRIGLLRKGASYIEQATLPMPGRLSLYNLILRLGPEKVLSPQVLAQIDLAAPGRHQQAVWDSAAAPDILNRELAFDWRYTLGRLTFPRFAAPPCWPVWGLDFPCWTTTWSIFRHGCRATTSCVDSTCAGSSRKRCAVFCLTRSSPSRSTASDCLSACGPCATPGCSS